MSVLDTVPATTESLGSIRAVFSAEIGGLNSCTSLAVGAHLDLPVVDCDTMGRAFPELQVWLITWPFVCCYGRYYSPPGSFE